MRKYIPLALTFSLILGSAGMVCSATSKPTKPLPKNKPANTGTVQLPGGAGTFGTVYSMRKGTPVYFRLVKAEYSTKQVVIGDQIIAPLANEKLLVLHFTIQNPQRTEQFVRSDALSITAVDSTNINHEGKEDWGDDTNGKSFAMSMKPAQTSAIYTAVRVPAKGIVPKLMILPAEGDGPVLRYDLNDPKNKVTPLTAPAADPADKSGYTALETVPGVVGTAYPYLNFDITVEKFEYSTDQLAEQTPEEGARFLVATLLLKNESPADQYVRGDAITPVLTSTDGEELSYKDMILASANRAFAQNVKGKAEVHVRIFFAVPKDSTAKTLSIKEGDSRTYTFNVQ